MTKYLILGNGFIGKRFQNFLQDSTTSSARINSIEDVKKEIEKHNPEFVINCIGKTGRPNIDWCEEHKEETFQSNFIVPLHIFSACYILNKKMVHISSGCIYEGDKNFTEKDEPNFKGSFYSETKALAEFTLKNFNVLQLRLRMPLDSQPSERNLIDKLLKYNKVIEVPNSITIISDFLQIAKQLMDRNITGIFNVVNKNPITHKQLLQIYYELTNQEMKHIFIKPEELDKMTKARRSNCTLSTKKLEDLGIEVRDVEEAVKDCLKQYVSSS